MEYLFVNKNIFVEKKIKYNKCHLAKGKREVPLFFTFWCAPQIRVLRKSDGA